MINKFLALAESWRTKALHLQQKYGTASPNTVLFVVTVLESCAEDVEELVAEEEKKNNPS